MPVSPSALIASSNSLASSMWRRGGNELSIGEPETTYPAVAQLAHFLDDFIHRVEMHLLAFHHRVDAITTVLEAAALGLNTNSKVATFKAPIQLGPD